MNDLTQKGTLPDGLHGAARCEGPQHDGSREDHTEDEALALLPEDLQLLLTRHKFKMFPCHDKKPAIAGWQAAATNNWAQIKSWQKEFPRCCWGVPTGQLNSIVVIDADIKPGEGVDGEQAFLNLWRTNEKTGFPETLEVRTGSAGAHWYFRISADTHLKGLVGALGKGLDLRAEGNLVIAPGSVRSDGGTYRIISKPEWGIAPLPDWLLRLLPKKTEPAIATGAKPAQTLSIWGRGADGGETETLPMTQAIEQARAELEQMMPEWQARVKPYAFNGIENEIEKLRTTPKGKRADRLFPAASALGEFVRGGWLTLEEAEQKLQWACRPYEIDKETGENQGGNNYSAEHRDTLTQIRNGLKKGLKNPIKTPAAIMAELLKKDAAAGEVVLGFGPEAQAAGATAGASATGKETTIRNCFADFAEKPTPVASWALDSELPEPDWIIDGSLPRGTLGVVVSPPGCGKSTLLLQLCLLLALPGGLLKTFCGYTLPTEGLKSVFITAEDGAAVLQRRIHAVMRALRLTEETMRDACSNMFVYSLHGRRTVDEIKTELQASYSSKDRPLIGINLFEPLRSGGIRATPNIAGLVTLLETHRPALLVLDTLSCFFGAGENDNVGMTTGMNTLAELAEVYRCTVLILHHTNKSGSSMPRMTKEGTQDIDAFLDPITVRGASSITGSARWILSLVPLQSALAAEELTDPRGWKVEDQADGSYLAGRVTKNNYGRPAPKFFLTRGKDGELLPCPSLTKAKETRVAKRRDSIYEDAIAIRDALVAHYAKPCASPFYVSDANKVLGKNGKPCNKDRGKAAITEGVAHGLFAIVTSAERKNCKILVLPEELPAVEMDGNEPKRDGEGAVRGGQDAVHIDCYGVNPVL